MKRHLIFFIFVALTAQADEVAVIGPKGEVFQAYGKKGNVIVKKCEDYTFPVKGKECQGKIHVPELKKEEFLHLAYVSVLTNPPPEFQKSVDVLFHSLWAVKKIDPKLLNSLKEKKQKMDEWAKAYGAEKIDKAEYVKLEGEIKRASFYDQFYQTRELIINKLLSIYNEIVDSNLIVSSATSATRDHILRNMDAGQLENFKQCSTAPQATSKAYIFASERGTILDDSDYWAKEERSYEVKWFKESQPCSLRLSSCSNSHFKWDGLKFMGCDYLQTRGHFFVDIRSLKNDLFLSPDFFKALPPSEAMIQSSQVNDSERSSGQKEMASPAKVAPEASKTSQQ